MDAKAPLQGVRVAVFESRFAGELANLVKKQGGEPLVAPTMVEAKLELGTEVRAFADALRHGEVDVLVVLTGVGNRKLVELIAPIMPANELGEHLSRIVVAARGPKSVGALKDLGIRPHVVAPPPHTWPDLLAALEAHVALPKKRVAVQQYGVPHERLTRALEERGAAVMQVPVYRWQLPDDLAPLERVIDALCSGQVDALLFTAGPQAGSLVEVARRTGREPELRAALLRCAVGSVGPSCTETLRNLEIEPDFEPVHGKMGQLVLEAARRVGPLLAHKRTPA